MNKIIEKCDVCINGSVVSKELLIKTFSSFVSSTIEDKQHNVGIVLHTGSVCFDAILLSFAAISNVLYNETNATDIVLSLQADDLVLCYDGNTGNSKPLKWIFKGFVNSVGDTPLMTPGKYIVLESDKNGRKYLPESRWTKIVPYFGSSKSMDGRGLRRESKKRYDFFRSVLGMEDAEIPRTVDTSTVIVMSREEANELVGSISFRFDDTDIKLTDLVPVSYYTESNREYQYGVNLSKNEPVIKITGKVSVARKLLLKKGGNRHIGLVVCGEDLVKFMQCPKCRQDLVVTRIITACECGHIDDFPWVKWVHCKNMYGGAKPICAHPTLTFKTSASSTEGLEGLTVSCESCGAKATLKGAFDKDALQELDQKHEGKYNFHCTGRHPWKHTKDRCGAYPKVLQRGSSSVYFPITVSSLVIPPYSSLITKKIEDSAAFADCKNIIAGYKRNVPKELLPMLIQSTIRDYAKKIAIEKGITTEKVQPILERKWIVPTGEDEYLTTSVKYRAEEYEALSGEVSMSTDDYGDFLREGTEISNYAIPFIKSISLIHKVREVQALVGFSRLKPVDANMGESSSEYVVPVKQQDTNWYPAYEVRGEGIFIEFDENAISEWQKDNPEIQHRVDVLNENYRKSFIGQSKPRKVTAKFLLLHTISHTLIKQLSFECGYSIASLKERLYCSEISEGKQMSGIFIYTASGDSEGTMGGLVRQGCADTFPGIFKKAMEEAMTCSNDPVCSLSMGQGRDSLNLSACYSCCLIPETSCEEFNIFLDRGTIVGTYENREMGFYSRQLYGTASWKDNSISKVTTDVSLKSSVHVIVTDYGTDLRDSVYAEIWNSLRTWAVDTKEKVLLSELESNSDLFSQKEKPYRDCMFQVGGNEEMQKCDLFWKESQVALFTSDNEECYAAAKNSDIRCIYCADDTVTVRKILDVLKEQ